VLSCIREASLESVLEAQGKTLWAPLPPNIVDDLPWQPILDGTLILDQPLEQLSSYSSSSSSSSAVNFSSEHICTVRNETLSFLYGALSKPLLSLLEFWLHPKDTSKIEELYPCTSSSSSATSDQEDCRPALTRLTTDFFFTCPTRRAATLLSTITTRESGSGSESGSESDRGTRLYLFLHPPFLDPMNNSSYCKGVVCHRGDLSYTFHSELFNSGYQWMETPQETLLSFEMLGLWSCFSLDNEPIPSSSASSSSSSCNP
jgi:hypothetical protein